MPYTSFIAVSRREIKDFFNLPYMIYKADKNWTAPLVSENKRVLDRRKNPYFRNIIVELFNCCNGKKICARAALIINSKYEKQYGSPLALFGFFESINDKEAVGSLFDRIISYCKSMGIKQLLGPFNPNHYSELGLQINCFNTTASFFQTYNPEYYFDLLSSIGFTINKKIHTRENVDISGYLHSRFGKMEMQVPEGYKLRTFNPHKKNDELENLRRIYNDAFEDNTWFLPLSRDEYLFSAKYLDLVTDPEMLLFAEYKGEPVGVIQFCYDINPLLKSFNGKIGPLKYLWFIQKRKQIDKLILYAIGIKKAHRNSKIIKVLLIGSLQFLKKFRSLETTWMTYDNHQAIGAAKHLGLNPGKEFVILACDI